MLEIVDRITGILHVTCKLGSFVYSTAGLFGIIERD